MRTSATRRWLACVVIAAAAACGGGSAPAGDPSSLSTSRPEDDATTDGPGSDDVHPLLIDGEASPLPTEYPHEVALDDGTRVVYGRGPTPGGYPWSVAYFRPDGSVEIAELDDRGEVQMRTYGDGGGGTSPSWKMRQAPDTRLGLPIGGRWVDAVVHHFTRGLYPLVTPFVVARRRLPLLPAAPAGRCSRR